MWDMMIFPRTAPVPCRSDFSMDASGLFDVSVRIGQSRRGPLVCIRPRRAHPSSPSIDQTPIPLFPPPVGLRKIFFLQLFFFLGVCGV